MEKIVEGQLTRLSLGRLGFIGELYDVRTESFSSRSLIKTKSLPHLVECRNVSQMEFDYKFITNASDRFELINVESELQVGVLSGFINLQGSGKFLMEEKKSEKSISCSLICKILTVSEKFFSPFDELLPHVDLTALTDPQYTHVIVQVNWGASCLFTLETTFDSDSEKKEVKGRLESEIARLKKILSFKGDGNLRKENSVVHNKNDIRIKIFADLVPDDNWPVSTEGFCQFVSDAPKLLKKENDGKGKPINYVMIPLSILRRMAKSESAMDVVVKRIDESFVLSIVYFFDEITEIKRKLYDLIMTLTANKKYVKEEEIRKARKEQETLSVKQTELKSIIAESWVDVKSGKIPLKNLITRIEKFKSQNLKLFTYEDFLDSYSSTLNKLSTVKHYISNGVIYLGRGEKFSELQIIDLSSEFIVLVTSTELEENNPELHKNISYYFLTLATEKKLNTKYVVVDLDYVGAEQYLGSSITEITCYHLKGTQTLSSNLYAEYLMGLKSNYAKLKQDSTMIHVQHKPGNRVVLEMICPGFEESACPSELLTWICYRCKSDIEYGFDDHFYCTCGKGSVDLFEYRCSNKRHGSFFISPTSEFLKSFLSKLRPLKEMNVLLLGQSGVGKSTWINSIVNYLTYDSLENAKKYGGISTIPASFTMYDSKTLKKHVIEVGKKSNNESTETGVSATQCSHTYSFLWGDRCVRIIDTPGLGDTRGVDQDKLNLKDIIDHIGHLKELHGVCILLRANDNRINVMFAYCLKELLAHLHKSVTKNIVFCFTNARSSFYSPGQTSALLERVFTNLGVDANLALGHHNMFCLDNEAFLFLCSLNHPEIKHDKELIKSFSQSWEISLKETKRLFNTVKSFEPHMLKETISLVTARNRILFLTKPLAECSKTIQLNLSVLEKKEMEIMTSKTTIEQLNKKLEYTEVFLESQPVSRPRTVCTSPKCVNYLTYKTLDVRDVEYKTHCHTECYLKPTPKTTNNIILKQCRAMNDDGKCKICNCSWMNHMHLTYTQKRVEKKVIDKNIEKFLKEEISAKEAVENFVKELKCVIDKYKKEQEYILQASVKFGMFLRRNAITCYNDSVGDYLEYLIKEEEEKPYKSETEKKLLENMKNTLAHYKAEVQILQEVINKGDKDTGELTTQDVYNLEQSLYKLELMGESIQKSVKISQSTNIKFREYLETPLQIGVPKSAPKKLSTKFWNAISFHTNSK